MHTRTPAHPRRRRGRAHRTALTIALVLAAVSLASGYRWAAGHFQPGRPGVAAAAACVAAPDPREARDAVRRDAPPAGAARPLPTAHAHNDFEHRRPLRDALAHGFTSVEADVWLVDGRLLVGHDRDDLTRTRTLERLYLAPLEALRRSRGAVYPGWDGGFQLVVDVKSRARATYAALEDELARHPRLLTASTAGRTERRPVTAVVTGNRAPAAMLDERTRYAGIDGGADRPHDAVRTTFMPLVSADWGEEFTWDGTCAMPPAEERRLRAIVTAAHGNGQRVRFWDTPDRPGPAREAVWRKLVAVGVDHLVTDDLAGLQAFLAGSTSRGPQPSRPAASSAQ